MTCEARSPRGMVKREPGETLREAAVRETREETGLEVTAGAVVHISERIWETHDLFVTFRAHPATPTPPVSGDPDILEVAWTGWRRRSDSCPTTRTSALWSTSPPPTRAGEASSDECRGFTMRASEVIRTVWVRFHGMPMETFTKGWWLKQCGGIARQRTVAEMSEHRRLLGAGGNCFDLALWVRDELAQAGISARIVGHDLETPDAHVAVLAVDPSGAEYLCDLGDLWLQPILVSPEHPAFSPDWQPGFFPGRLVQIHRSGNALEVFYRRAGGKMGTQVYDLSPISEEQCLRACDFAQNLLRRPFCEMLLPHPDTGAIEHWEYDRQASFWNLADGPVFEEPCDSLADWIARITARTGMAPELIATAFEIYRIVQRQKQVKEAEGYA